MAHLRIACLRVPLFPLAARLRQEPELEHTALVILDGKGSSTRVVAAARRARRAGIVPGLSLPQARAILPDLVSRLRDPDGERVAQQVLLEVAESLSPKVEDGEEGVVHADVTGMERHFPVASLDSVHSVNPEMEMGHVATIVAQRLGLPIRVGVGASKLVASMATLSRESPAVVPCGEEAAFLAPLPVRRLDLTPRVAAQLSRFGIQTLGELAALDIAPLVSRLGEEARRIHAAACGRDERPLIARRSAETFTEAASSCEWPLRSLDAFLDFARPLLERLMQRLEACAVACRRLTFEMKLDPEGHDARSIELPAPTRDVGTLLALLRLDLASRPPGANVMSIALGALPDRPRLVQQSLFGPPALSPEKLATTIARLAARLGPDRVGAPQVADGHRPERFALDRFDPPPPPVMRVAERAPPDLISMRVLRPPIRLEVVQDGGWPRHVQSVPEDGKRRRSLAIRGEVRVASGPWACEEGWWSAGPLHRDYYDVELERGLFRIYYDRLTGTWFADGVYD